MIFHSEFELRNGWQYFLVISAAVKSDAGMHFPADRKIELRTAGKHRDLVDPLYAPKTYKIVGFGDTHEPLLDVYPEKGVYSSIYANTGSWVDKSESKYNIRTYRIITPGAWSGSAIDVVSLYQYNLEEDNGGTYEPKLLAEKTI